MEQRISLITLGVADAMRSKAFYEALGWRGQSPDGDVVFFHCNTLHSAGQNRSDQVKFSLVYTYHGVSNRPLPGTRSAAKPEVQF